MVPALNASSGIGVALVSVSVTGAGSAGREAPVTGQTAVTLPTICSRYAHTLTGQLIAE